MNPLAEGEAVELTGTAQLLDDPLFAPLTGEPCIAHVTRARVFTRLDHVGDHVGDFDSIEVARFVVATPHGLVHVLDRPAVVSLDPESVAWVEDARQASFLGPRRVAQYIRSTFFEQALIRPGETVTVAGVIAREADAVLEAGFRDLRVRTRLTGYGNYPLTLRRGRR